MNKIVNQRYSSYGDVAYRSPTNHYAKNHILSRNSNALTTLVQKQTQIDLVKKRISALCLRDQKYTHRTLNTEIEMEKKQAIKKQSERIQKLLEKQRKKQTQKIEILKNRNLQSRADNYFRARSIREKRQLQTRQKSHLIRSKSKQYTMCITQQKRENVQTKKHKSKDIYQKTLMGRQERSRVLLEKREQVIGGKIQEAQHLGRLEEIKDNQLRQLGKLELIMVQKSNTSRAAYQASRERVSNNTKYSTKKMIKSARESNPQKLNFSLNLY